MALHGVFANDLQFGKGVDSDQAQDDERFEYIPILPSLLCPSSCFPNIRFLEQGLDGLSKRNKIFSSNYGINFLDFTWLISFLIAGYRNFVSLDS
jgi:hypothetical protein